ncbi:hypothetical protein GGU10DRAFT_353580 [Lentinula aff. detonsa]|uniref:Uncharacterized protein n=1 Tax=Lentinula aff. detonsa TaxID=2804958 RepID=A0AA38KWE0_9AGAR|nr:hypothetical protein GGU10DRAFT_353580 [Lentinula aff. detonsa]
MNIKLMHLRTMYVLQAVSRRLSILRPGCLVAFVLSFEILTSFFTARSRGEELQAIHCSDSSLIVLGGVGSGRDPCGRVRVSGVKVS